MPWIPPVMKVRRSVCLSLSPFKGVHSGESDSRNNPRRVQSSLLKGLCRRPPPAVDSGLGLVLGVRPWNLTDSVPRLPPRHTSWALPSSASAAAGEALAPGTGNPFRVQDSLIARNDASLRTSSLLPAASIFWLQVCLREYNE